MNMDVYFKSQGYERISLDRVTDLNAPTHQGKMIIMGIGVLKQALLLKY